MKTKRKLRFFGALAYLLLPIASFALAQEQHQETNIERSELPPAVEKTVAREGKRLSVRGFSKETEHGQTLYEAKFRIPGAWNKSLLIDENGSVIAEEEWISTAALPRAVLQSIKVQAGHGKIIKVQTITKNGQVTAYEAKIMTNGKRTKIQVSQDGRLL